MTRHKRESLEIMKEILGVMLLNRNISPTRILYKANLSPQNFKDYTLELIERGLISKIITDKKMIIYGKKYKPGRQIFNLTELGREFLEDYKAVDLFLEKYGLNEE